MIIETKEMKIVVVKPLNKNFKLVKPSILLGDKINQLSSLLPHDVKCKTKKKPETTRELVGEILGELLNQLD